MRVEEESGIIGHALVDFTASDADFHVVKEAKAEVKAEAVAS